MRHIVGCRAEICRGLSKWMSKMTSPPFDKIFIDPEAMQFLGALPAPVRECLTGAFRDIKHRKLELEVPTPWRVWDGPSFVKVCQHLIFASVSEDKNVVVILEIQPD